MDIANSTIETSLALLNAKMDSHQQETTTKLDGLEKLMTLHVNHQTGALINLTKAVKDNHDAINKRVDDHEDRQATLETNEAQDRGTITERKNWQAVIIGIITGLFTTVAGWWLGHLPKLP